MPEAKQVESMFAGIAGKYDRANRILSGGLDIYWRHRLTGMVAANLPSRVADLATGSGDVAFTLRKKCPQNTEILGFDFCEPLLEIARNKQKGSSNPVSFAFGDCLNLPLEDDSVDAITIAFGLRNLEDRHRGLLEMRRVLRPDSGRLFVLEFTQPDRWFRPVYYLYLKSILPLIARIATGNRNAYEYLAGSIEAFPSKSDLTGEIAKAGFSNIQATGLTASIVAIHQAQA